MFMKKSIYYLISLMLIGGLFIVSCNNEEDKDKKEDIKDTGDVTLSENNTETFYLVPSPKDIFGFTDDKHLTFNLELLNPIENTESYIDSKSNELNFGVYAADLAYAAAFQKGNETVNYLTVVRQLSDKIGISAVFNESLTKRIENLTNNKDSLISVSSDTYFDIIRYLEKNERISTLAFIATGGWLESLYIVTSVTEYEEGNKTVQAIADQKIVFSNLIMYLEQNQEDESIREVLDKLMPIKEIYDALEVINIEDHPKTDDNEKIVVGGSAKISITEEQFNKLKQTISDIRNNFTGNDVQ